MDRPLRPAWVEIDLDRFRKNLRAILQEKPQHLGILSVVKDNAYGHGALAIARTAQREGIRRFAVATVDEALSLKRAGLEADLFIFGRRTAEELEICIRQGFIVFLHGPEDARDAARTARLVGKKARAHIEVDTGLGRYGVRWDRASAAIPEMCSHPELSIGGIMSHFAQSDEADKSYAMLQLERFQQVLQALEKQGIRFAVRHMCNSGGYLDLPQAHFDWVRIGILPLGVFPSQVCRRISGIQPIMTVKSRVALLKDLEPGDCVGYGMHYTAQQKETIAVIPVGYADGYPRVRNKGFVLIRGQKAPVVGGNAMDAMMVRVTHIGVQLWDEVVLLGRQGSEEIDAHLLASWKGTVSYDVLAGWRTRIPRVYLEGNGIPERQ